MTTSREQFLETADRIGSRLCRDAVWSDGACNWMCWTSTFINGGWSPSCQALGPSEHNPLAGVNLYSGTAGIGLFLARLTAITSDPIHRRTLTGIVNQIIQQPMHGGSVGFYSGLAGIYYTLIESGYTLEQQHLIDRGLSGLGGLQDSELQPASLDVIEGSAGLIPVLLCVASRFDRSDLLDLAVQHGQYILNEAHRSDDGWSWDTVPVPVRRHLTGFSHGASGIAFALVKLYATTGESRFLDAARQAMNYERSQFDESNQNWIDHRLSDSPDADSRVIFRSLWCHGAPGIALARLAARTALPDDPEVCVDMDASLATTAADLEHLRMPGERDWCLCHGLGGNSDVLITASDALSDRKWRDRAEVVGHWGIDHIQGDHIPWPCNFGGEGEHPGLMTGLSGVGHFYLRLFDSDRTPSALIPAGHV